MIILTNLTLFCRWALNVACIWPTDGKSVLPKNVQNQRTDNRAWKCETEDCIEQLLITWYTIRYYIPLKFKPKIIYKWGRTSNPKLFSSRKRNLSFHLASLHCSWIWGIKEMRRIIRSNQNAKKCQIQASIQEMPILFNAGDDKSGRLLGRAD